MEQRRHLRREHEARGLAPRVAQVRRPVRGAAPAAAGFVARGERHAVADPAPGGQFGVERKVEQQVMQMFAGGEHAAGGRAGRGLEAQRLVAAEVEIDAGAHRRAGGEPQHDALRFNAAQHGAGEDKREVCVRGWRGLGHETGMAGTDVDARVISKRP